jgi:hypothetical protein
MTQDIGTRPAPTSPTGVATGRVGGAAGRGPEHEALEVFIGKWMTQGHTIAGPGAPAVPILASDVYEWVPGGFFILHTAYGRIGDVGVGGVEMIGYDAPSRTYRMQFFDSQGNNSTSRLTHRGDTWLWQGEKTRCTGTFSADGRTLVAHHERTDDGVSWVPSMDVTLSRVD